MCNPITISVSSVGVSRHINLDWRSGAHTAFAVTGSSSGTFAYQIESTVDDLQLTGSPTWTAESSAPLTANSSVWEITKPIAALRLNSTALSLASLTLKLLQDHGY